MIHKKEKFCISCLIIISLFVISCVFYTESKESDRGFTIIGIPEQYNGKFISSFFALSMSDGYKKDLFYKDEPIEIKNGSAFIGLYSDSTYKDSFTGYGIYAVVLYIDLDTPGSKQWSLVSIVEGNAVMHWEDGYGTYLPDQISYDPEKAGAEIIASYDISDFVPVLPWREQLDVDISATSDSFYFQYGNVIHIVDRESMKKTGEIPITIPTNAPFNVWHFTTFADKCMFGTYSLYNEATNSLTYPLFLMDMDGQNQREIDVAQELGIPWIEGLGYDKATETIWAVSSDRKKIIHYSYDGNSDIFTKSFERDSYNLGASYHIVNHDTIPFFLSMYGSESWNMYNNLALNKSGMIIDKRNMDNSEESLGEIWVRYLGVADKPIGYPLGMLYEPPYLWIVIQKDEKIQLLKLLPNE